MDRKEDLEATGERFRESHRARPAGERRNSSRAGGVPRGSRASQRAGGLRRPFARRRRQWLSLVAASALAAGAAAVWILTRPVMFQIGETRQGQLGSVIEATDGRAVPISFSEGSKLLLHPGGRIRVLSLKRDDARVLVEDGVVDATVAHRGGATTRWDSRWAPITSRSTARGSRWRSVPRTVSCACRPKRAALQSQADASRQRRRFPPERASRPPARRARRPRRTRCLRRKRRGLRRRTSRRREGDAHGALARAARGGPTARGAARRRARGLRPGLSDCNRERAAGARGRRPVFRTVPACRHRPGCHAGTLSQVDGGRDGRVHPGADRLRKTAGL